MINRMVLHNPLLENVYVINLDKDTQRLKKITSNLHAYGVEFTRVPGIYGASLTPEQLQKYTTTACRSLTCSKSIIGCALSHMKTWNIIAQAPAHTWHLVLEDDVSFTDTTIQKLDMLYRYINQNSIEALISIHCSNPYQMMCTLPTSRNSFDPSVPIVGNTFTVGTPAYLLTPEIARQILKDSHERVSEHLDAWWSLRYSEATFPQYFVTKERYVKVNYNSKESGNMTHTPVMPVTSLVLRRLELDEIDFMLHVTLFTIGMKYEVNLYTIILLTLLLINTTLLHSTFLYIYIVLELCVHTLLQVQNATTKKTYSCCNNN